MTREVLFDVSGAKGSDGRDGRRGQNGSRGQAGIRGGDASHPSPGGNAGRVQLILRSGASSSELGADAISLRAQVSGANGAARETAEVYGAEAMPQVRLLARGGAGGHGAAGGAGGNGGRGQAGMDASRHRSGTNGGPGGDGGDGGRGSSGARGGDGGNIMVEVDERDAYLLMAVAGAESPAALVEPGPGGRRGRHGSGGAGGPGGRGGRSYSWTETDRQGNTRTHRQRGGSSGPSGRSGFTPNSPLSAGSPGAPGRFEIHMLRPGGRDVYQSRYDLEILSFHFVEAPGHDRDGILEFGEEILVQNVRLRNIGSMPTPKHQRIRLTLAANQWVLPLQGEAIFVERSLAPGEEFTLPGLLRFRIGRPKSPPLGDALIVTESICPEAHQLGVEVPTSSGDSPFSAHFANADLTRTFTARYPVENRNGVQALRSLAHGERTRQRFDIHNLTNQAMGQLSPRKRALALQIQWQEGKVPAEGLIFLGADGQEVPLEESMGGFSGYFLPIPELAANSSIIVETQVGFRGAVEPYKSATLRFTIWMGDIEDPKAWTAAQCRDLTIRLEPAYSYRPDARVMIVSNNNTTRRAFVAWYHVLEDSFGLASDFWSISRYGHFDHQVELADQTNLRVRLEDQVVVVLNQHFEPRGDSQTDLPTDYMRARDFRESATAANTRYLIVGERDFQMQQWLEPNSDFRLSGSDFPSISRFLQKEEQSAGTYVEETFRDDITMCFDEITVEARALPFLRPSINRIFRIAHKLQKRLSRLFPNRRYVVIYHHADEMVKTGRSWLVLPRWRIGHIEVRRTLNLEKSEAVALQAGDDEINDEAFVVSDEVRYAIGLALSFEEKLERLNWLLQQEEGEDVQKTALALVRAIVADLTTEQAAIRESGAKLTGEFYEQRFANFGRLMRYPFYTHISRDSAKWTFLCRLCAGIEAMTMIQDGGWLFRRRDRAITSEVMGQMRGFRSRLFDGHALDMEGEVAMDSSTAAPQIQTFVNSFTEQLRREYRALGWRGRWNSSLSEVGRHRFQHPRGFAERVERDIDRWLVAEQRVWNAAELRRAQQDEARREAKQEELRLLNSEARTDLLVRPESAKVVFEEATEAVEVKQV